MCQALENLREAMGAYASSFEPASLSAAEARVVLGAVTAIEHMAATLKALAAARVADGAGPARHAQRVVVEDLARATGTSLGRARQTVEVGRRLPDQAQVVAAASRGDLSPDQLAGITDAAAANPAAQRRLLAAAAGGSSADLRDEIARTKAAAEPDPERRRAEIHRDRRLRWWIDAGGVWHLHATGLAEHGAQIMAALAPQADDRFDQARRQDRRERSDAYAFDALVQLAMDATSPRAESDLGAASGGEGSSAGEAVDFETTDDRRDSQPRPPGGRVAPRRRRRQRRGAQVKLLLRLDLDVFFRGFPCDGDVCELVGYGPVTMAGLQELLDLGDPLVSLILTRAKRLVGVAHHGRQATAHQRSALEWLYPLCAVQGCRAQAHLQIDHRLDGAQSHYTLLDRLDRLCTPHHNLKSRQGWALVEGSGKRAFVPPGDPRHPGRGRPAPTSAV